jgi:hypothetical protein
VVSIISFRKSKELNFLELKSMFLFSSNEPKIFCKRLLSKKEPKVLYVFCGRYSVLKINLSSSNSDNIGTINFTFEATKDP